MIGGPAASDSGAVATAAGGSPALPTLHRADAARAAAVRQRTRRGGAWRNLRKLPAVAGLTLFTVLVSSAFPAGAVAPSPPPATVAEIEASAPADAWRRIAPDNLLLLDTPKGTLTIELAPGFAPAHVAAIRALVRAGAFAGGAVTRVQDNYVVQWGTKAAVAALAGPPGPAPAAATPPGPAPAAATPGPAPAELPPEYERAAGDVPFTALPYPDAYAAHAGFSDGWPVATNGPGDGAATWLVHCYAMVGAGRNNPPSTGDGSELYAVIGHAPRHLDRNLAVVGRVIDGLAPFAALPRGTEALGFYKTAAEMVPITGATLASDIPVLHLRPHWQVLRTDTPTFAALIAARANRREPFFARPANGVDVCNVKIPVRRVP